MTRRRGLVLGVVILLIYCVLTLMMTWPLIVQMTTHLAGDDVDVFINPWATWWTRKVLTEGLDLYHTEYLFYPRGVSLLFHSFSHTNTVLALVLEPSMGVIAAQNVTTLLAYALSGFSTYLLVYELFSARGAAFVAGMVFAFSSYRLDQALHLVIVSTQWIPLFFLFLDRVLKQGGIWNVIWAVAFLLLCALTSWHLLLFTLMFSGPYLVVRLLLSWREGMPLPTRSLIAFVALIVLVLSIFAWPQLRGWFGPSSYGAAPVVVKTGQSLDILAFLVPSYRHPIWGQYVSTFQLRTIKATRSVFVGFLPLAFVAYALVRRNRVILPWAAAGGVFWVFSLGPYPRLLGRELLTLPWGLPLMQVFRVSHRFHIMTTLAIAVIVGWGWKQGLDKLTTALGRRRSAVIMTALSAGILLEHAVIPMTCVPVQLSEFVETVGREHEEYAVIDLPLGREFARYYMFQQIFHGKPLVGGVVSRTPEEAYNFVRGDALWGGQLESGDLDTTLGDVSRHLDYLADANVRYVIVHQDKLSEDQLSSWRDYFTITPFYEDDLIVVYPTTLRAGRDFELISELAAGIGLIEASVIPHETTQAGTVFVDLGWGSRAAPEVDLEVCLRLVGESGVDLQEQCHPLVEDWPTSEWSAGAVGVAQYALQVDPHQEAGEHALNARLVVAETGQGIGETVRLATVVVQELPRSFEIPELGLGNMVSEAFGQDLRLLGYELHQRSEELRLTLHWRAESRISSYYKFFVHLFDKETSELAAQLDWVPRNWTYPTSWWETGEIVSEEIVLPVAAVPDGEYILVLGVYVPDGDRLLTSSGEDVLILDEVIVGP